MDDILMKLGELAAERRHRKENETLVEVHYRNFCLSWQVGNYLDIYDCFLTNKIFIARLDVSQFDYFGRPLAIAIKGIIDGFDNLE